MKRERKIICPHCKKKFAPTEENHAVKPFCSKRCQVIDLGSWLGEKYVVESKKLPDDE